MRDWRCKQRNPAAVFPFAVLRDTNTSIGIDGNYVRAAAGCSWDELVSFTIRSELYGLENLSGIPGRVGAAPIQNIGAYGAQLADTLVELTVFDGLTQRYETMDISELGFGYRTSRFKKSSESHLVIVDLLLKLSEQFVPNIDYQGVAQLISVDPASGSNVTASEVRIAVLILRANKLPNPDKVGNVGSFFQNPVVTDGEARRLSGLGLQIWEGSAGTKFRRAADRTIWPKGPEYGWRQGIKAPLLGARKCRRRDLPGCRPANETCPGHRPPAIWRFSHARASHFPN